MNETQPKPMTDYDKPPVIEVVCSIVFEKIRGFKAHHLGLFWQKVREQFPECEHAARLGFDPEKEAFDLSKYLPRVWFVSKEQNKLLQLQDDRFLFNWRRMEDEEAYPRYSKIIDAFRNNLGIFEAFLEEEGLESISPKDCELTYVNHIPRGEGLNSLGDMNKVFRDFCWNSTNGRFLPEPVRFGGQISFGLPENKGLLNLRLQQGERKVDKNPVLILHNSAVGLGPDKSMEAVWKWFELAHEWIVLGFADLTESTIQKEVWQRKDNS